MTFPPEIYFGLGAAVLTALAVLAWMTRRKRPPTLPADRVEPLAATQEDVRLEVEHDAPEPFGREEVAAMGGMFEEPTEPDYPPVTLADAIPAGPDLGRLASGAAIACEYKGFKIGLAEKQPGLWIGIVMRQDGKRKKRAAQEPWTTREFYQMPAALAEAKALVDRGAL